MDYEYQKFTELCKVNPPNFRGTFGPDKAEEWVKVMEKIFSVLLCAEKLKVAFTIYVLGADVEILVGWHKKVTWTCVNSYYLGNIQE